MSSREADAPLAFRRALVITPGEPNDATTMLLVDLPGNLLRHRRPRRLRSSARSDGASCRFNRSIDPANGRTISSYPLQERPYRFGLVTLILRGGRQRPVYRLTAP